jgi:NTE family protein
MTVDGSGIGVVLGAGGNLGAAWMIARLYAIEQAAGVDLRTADLVVGSSAGSVLAAMITSGVSVSQLLAHQQGDADDTNPLTRSGFDYDTSVGGALPERPPLRLGSARLLRQVARHPRRHGFMTALAAAAPPGRGSLAGLTAALQSSLAAAARDGSGVDSQAWPPPLRIASINYLTGERVIFGAVGAPRASVVDAVLASCSIPGWFPPTLIDGQPYVDAGFRQATSADVAAGCGLRTVYVLAPLASVGPEPPPPTRLARLERRWRRYLTRTLDREVAALREDGIEPIVVTPTAEERAAMGANLMDPRRRTRVLEIALRTAETAG